MTKAIKITNYNFDFTFMKKEIGDDESIIKDFIILFNDMLAQYHKDMQLALKNKDFLVAQQSSHKIAPSCTLLGLTSLQEIIKSIEKRGASKKDFGKIKEEYDIVELYIEKLIPQIEKIVQKN